MYTSRAQNSQSAVKCHQLLIAFAQISRHLPPPNPQSIDSLDPLLEVRCYCGCNSIEQRKWLTEMSQRFAPVGKNMHSWGFWTNSQCPCCHQDNEDEEHLFKCTHQKCRDIRLEATRVLWQRLQRCKTEPQL
jgi:hypothetical protein